jgi:hypothetical protein
MKNNQINPELRAKYRAQRRANLSLGKCYAESLTRMFLAGEDCAPFDPAFPFTRSKVSKRLAACKEFLASYRTARAEWVANVRRFGLDGADSHETASYAMSARVYWLTELRRWQAAPVGDRFCNLSPTAQKKMQEQTDARDCA